MYIHMAANHCPEFSSIFSPLREAFVFLPNLTLSGQFPYKGEGKFCGAIAYTHLTNTRKVFRYLIWFDHIGI